MRDHNAGVKPPRRNPQPGSPKNNSVDKPVSERPIFDQAILDALPAEIALLDRDGIIIAVNKQWLDFGADNGCLGGAAVSDNYFAASEKAAAEGDEYALDALKGIRSVLAGEADRFSLEYPCDGPDLPRWFRLDASPCGDGSEPMVVVMHTDITEARLLAEAQRS